MHVHDTGVDSGIKRGRFYHTHFLETTPTPIMTNDTQCDATAQLIWADECFSASSVSVHWYVAGA